MIPEPARLHAPALRPHGQLTRPPINFPPPCFGPGNTHVRRKPADSGYPAQPHQPARPEPANRPGRPGRPAPCPDPPDQPDPPDPPDPPAAPDRPDPADQPEASDWPCPRVARPLPGRGGSFVLNLTTVAGCSRTPAPTRTISAGAELTCRSTSRAVTISSGAVAPLSASISPPGRAMPAASSARRSSRATARETTTSAINCPAISSARPRVTSTLERSSSCTHSLRNVVRRAIGSSNLTLTSGSSMASTMPGSPAPEPRSTRSHRWGISSASTALLSRCRSQILLASPGPIRPRATAGPASSCAYAFATGSADPKIRRASSGGSGARPAPASADR